MFEYGIRKSFTTFKTAYIMSEKAEKNEAEIVLQREFRKRLSSLISRENKTFAFCMKDEGMGMFLY